MNRPFQLGRSHREECFEQLPALVAALDEATRRTFSARMNNLLTIQPKLRDKVPNSLQTSLNPAAYAVETSANGSNPSRRFVVTLSKSQSLHHKVMAICLAVAEIDLFATGQLHFRTYSDGATRFTWRTDRSKHLLGNAPHPWDEVVLDRAFEVYRAIVHLIPGHDKFPPLPARLNRGELELRGDAL